MNVAMFCQGMTGGARSNDELTDDCCDGEKKPVKDKRWISKPNSFERIEIGSAWWASFTLICNCLSLQHFILPQSCIFLQLTAGESILTEAICVPQ